MTPPVDKTLIIACGALAREIRMLVDANDFTHVDLACLPATLHNTPQFIPEAVRARIEQARGDYAKIYCAYADCGTGGMLDRVLAHENVPRLEGAHCYAFFAGQDAFAELSEPEPGTFYLTDFLVRQFDTLVIEALGLDCHPELRDAYFSHYKRLIYLSQTADEDLTGKAKCAAERLGLAFEQVHTGMGELANFVESAAHGEGRAPSVDSLPDHLATAAAVMPGSVWKRRSARTRGRRRGRISRRS
ncbi:MAG: DUF1638 domain-containing protein [Geminicoccaceae bacterium]|nr:DUF1638 domain-containing protein [Geminicoccaceae bacterium]MCB9945458.1 DUF1638 domain-containing protein [Geminicoccaceae bacterium]